MPGAKTFSLAVLGRELDSARRARNDTLVSDSSFVDKGDEDPVAAVSPCSSLRSPSTSSEESEETVERPFPLCLVCLTRPPTAVLLPCCHLNLCHLCAPLLIMRHKSGTTGHAASLPRGHTLVQPGSEPSRWNQVLARATASHPKARQLSMGAYLAPDLGACGAEITSSDLLKPSYDLDETTPESSTVRASVLGEGRVVLGDIPGEASASRAKCLMCRSGVRGWLRVYPG